MTTKPAPPLGLRHGHPADDVAVHPTDGLPDVGDLPRFPAPYAVGEPHPPIARGVGSPLHPSRTLPTGEVHSDAGLSAIEVGTGRESLADLGLTDAKLDSRWTPRTVSLSVTYGVAFHDAAYHSVALGLAFSSRPTSGTSDAPREPEAFRPRGSGRCRAALPETETDPREWTRCPRHFTGTATDAAQRQEPQIV